MRWAWGEVRLESVPPVDDGEPVRALEQIEGQNGFLFEEEPLAALWREHREGRSGAMQWGYEAGISVWKEEPSIW